MIKLLHISPLLLLFCFYLMICPLYFQGGDTAELVNAAYHLFVPHPPGYPLYVWLQHLWLTMTSFSTVYFRASLLTTLFSFCSIILLSISLRRRMFLLFIPVVLLGMNPDFIESSVLPDVFSLHGLFVTLFFTIFLYGFRWGNFLIPFLFCLSLSNHHTSIFLFPILIYHFKFRNKESWIGLLSGSALCALFYLSIKTMNHSHPYSWGVVNNVDSIIDHFLRKDYGTFNLAAKGNNQGFNAILFLLRSLAPGLGMLGLIMTFNRNFLSDKKILVSLLALVFCFIFTLMGNISPTQVGEEILKRFHVMPLVIVVSIIAYMANKIIFTKNYKFMFFTFMACTSVYYAYNLRHFLNLRNDSIIEDYSRNLYESARRNTPTVIFANSDTAFFGLRYVSAFYGAVPDQHIAVVSPEIFFHPWFSDKMRILLPEFELLNKNKVYDQKRLNVEEDIIRPNLKKYNFLMTSKYTDGTWFKVVFLPLGRLIQEGSGTFFNFSAINELKINYSPKEVPEGSQHFTKGYIFYHYSHIYMAHAYKFWASDNIMQAKIEWEKAIQVVTFALPAMVNLCQHFPNQYDFCMKKRLNDLEEKTSGFFEPN